MNDMFRSRKQNTSRPPSMHVDDFMAMEHAKTQDSPPPMRRTGPKVHSTFLFLVYGFLGAAEKVARTKVVYLANYFKGGGKVLRSDL